MVARRQLFGTKEVLVADYSLYQSDIGDAKKSISIVIETDSFKNVVLKYRDSIAKSIRNVFVTFADVICSKKVEN